MAAPGHGIVVDVSTDDATYVLVDGFKEISFENSDALLDTTDFMDGFERTYIQGLRDGSFSVSGDWEGVDPGQVQIRASAAARTALWLRVRWDGTNGLKALVLFENTTQSGSVEDIVSFNVSGKTSGSQIPVP